MVNNSVITFRDEDTHDATKSRLIKGIEENLLVTATSINRQVVRLMGLTEDTEDNHWLSIHALRMRSTSNSIQKRSSRLPNLPGCCEL